jgi:hypothetical protein
MSYTLIERKELTSAASGIEFTGIPQFYSDMVVVCSLRSTSTFGVGGVTWFDVLLSVNGNTSNLSNRFLAGNGASASSSAGGGEFVIRVSDSATTANTFGSASLYFPNYAGATAKSISLDNVSETNATNARQAITAGLWNNTAPITSLAFNASSGNIAAGSSISLYGINRQQAIGKPKAIGGAISFANGHWVHSFTGSGTFNALEDLEVDALLVAGGGGGGSFGGGGGAGGFLSVPAQRVSAGFYNVLVGAGGARSVSGENSLFNTTLAIGGGRGGSFANAGANGGSGGGVGPDNSTVGLGTSGQGNNGGLSFWIGASATRGSGGGGGALSGGSNASSATGGAGGTGRESSITGFLVRLAGGGGGEGHNNGGAGGAGGGANGGTNSVAAGNGQANTGGGGGGAVVGGGAGGSGIVIIRYKA